METIMRLSAYERSGLIAALAEIEGKINGGNR